MKLFIAAIVAVMVSGCAGGLGPQLASGGSGNWSSGVLNPPGGGNE